MNIDEKIKMGKQFIKGHREKEERLLSEARDKWNEKRLQIMGMKQRIADFLVLCCLCSQYPEFRSVQSLFSHDNILYITMAIADYKASISLRNSNNVKCFIDEDDEVVFEFHEPVSYTLGCFSDNLDIFIQNFERLEKQVDDCYFKIISEG